MCQSQGDNDCAGSKLHHKFRHRMKKTIVCPDPSALPVRKICIHDTGRPITLGFFSQTQACAPHRTAAQRTGASAAFGAAILKQCVESWYRRELLESRDRRATEQYV